jgi:hypothetical protein
VEWEFAPSDRLAALISLSPADYTGKPRARRHFLWSAFAVKAADELNEVLVQQVSGLADVRSAFRAARRAVKDRLCQVPGHRSAATVRDFLVELGRTTWGVPAGKIDVPVKRVLGLVHVGDGETLRYRVSANAPTPRWLEMMCGAADGTRLRSVGNAAGGSGSVFVHTPLQKEILRVLRGRALRQTQLELELRTNRRQLQRKTGLGDLRERGEVLHHDRLGYYRPDAPPPVLLPNSEVA